MKKNLKSLFLRINFQLNITSLKSENVPEKKQGISRFFTILTLQTHDSSLQKLTLFFLETSVLENMDDLKGGGGVI